MNEHTLSSDDDAVSGGCFCGAVRYRFTGDILWPGHCHCTACRRLSGGAGGCWFGIARDSGEVSGAVVFHQYTADSGNTVQRGVCAACRAPLYNINSKMSDVFIMAAGSLDNPELFSPRGRIWVGGAPTWAVPEDSLTRFEGMPQPKNRQKSLESKSVDR